MYGIQKFKEFINDLSSTINEFASIPSQHDNPHHTRDNALRRRSSWSDLPSFFKFNRDNQNTATNPSENDLKADLNSTQNGSNAANAKANNSTPVYTKTSRVATTVNRTPSLRTNSNGNVIPTTHRRVSSGSVQSLQYDSMNKGNSIRYQVNKSGSSRHMHPHSAPATPRGSHTPSLSPLTRQNVEFRNQAPSSPSLSKRPMNNTQGRKANNNSSSLDPRDLHYTSSSSSVSSYDSRHDPHDQRLRSISDPRKYNTSYQQQQQQQQQIRQELSKENLETFNQYGSTNPYDTNDRRNYRVGEHTRNFSSEDPSRKYQVDSSSRVGPHLDTRYGPNENRDSIRYGPNENRDATRYGVQDSREISRYNQGDNGDRYIQPENRELPARYGSSNDSRHFSNDTPTRYNKHQNRPYQLKTNLDAPFKPADSQPQHFQNTDHDRRITSSDSFRGHHSLSSSPQKHGQLYRNDVLSNDNNGRSTKNRRNPQFQGGRVSPDHYYATSENDFVNGIPSKQHRRGPSDSELLNGAPSQQFYDDMISQISNQIARVSEGGAASQQAFKTNGGVPNPPTNKNMTSVPANEDDDNEWC